MAGTVQRVVLAGGGHAHLAVLDDWARAPLPGVEKWLVTAAPFTAYSGMIPGWIAGHYPPGAHRIDLRPLARRAGATLVIDSVEALDADKRRLTLASGRTVDFDVLSLAVGGEVDTGPLSQLAGRLLPVRPMDAFAENWPAVLESASGQQNFSLVVVGGGAAGIELAFAAEYALRQISANAKVSLVAGEPGILAGHSRAVIAYVREELARRNIEIFPADAVGTRDSVVLSTGEAISADFVIAATGSTPPSWLAGSGLALDGQGFVEIGSDLKSRSHPNIFAAGDIVTRTDVQVARSGVHAVHAGPALAANLRATFDGASLRRYIPRKRTLYLLATGDRRAILSWGGLAARGRSIWLLKDWIDRRFVRRHTVRAKESAAKLGRRMITNPVRGNALRVALVVGTCLNVINQGADIWLLGELDLPRFLMNYAVPYLVASYSAAKARGLMDS
ncbi:FAD-dependent oxidoreductase [Allopontixanthobacter sp.]|uniref:FAD-dependent oxidoreductase n=1 Tax=Allopontixanthobacter sp. TaxID=2906452 RepID=UPI002AB83D9C|nr:FAD-dependent oxidoreductase [Allopontixanthobacter sp.]MDZ4307020.1 FAD-dependent oxidoreductase [Allopontixanthobacter sp.]